MPNVMAAHPNIGGALCESSAISFLIPRRKVWLTPTGRVPCSNAANIGNSVRGQKPPKMYIVPAQETAKHRAKFGWRPVSDVAAVTKPRRETH